MRVVASVAVALVLASVACRKSAPPAPEASAPRPVGLHDPANAPRLVAAVKEIRAKCTAAIGDYDDDCDAARAYRALKVTKADAPTLVAFFEDADPGVAAFGAYHAARHRDFFRDDAALAQRLVAIGEGMRPPNDAAAPELAGILCRVDRDKAQLGERITKLARDAPSVELRAGLVSCLLRARPNDAALRSLADEAQRSPDELVRRAATSALTSKPPTVEECHDWARDLTASRASVIEAAVEKILSGRKQYDDAFVRGRPDGDAHNWCPPDVIDAALAAYPRRFEEGGLTDRWIDYLGDLGWATNVAREQRAKAFAFAKLTYERSPTGDFGRAALLAMAKLDPEAARPLVLAHGTSSTAAKIDRTTALATLEERTTQPLE
ncbi:MAG: hypothetical protein KIT84_20820 [Labilithrix sp.]|nr:hypothetical protein [Labilithrix sp.]MCW5813485.1 hypothetical protein [Labilithrix sp.]